LLLSLFFPPIELIVYLFIYLFNNSSSFPNFCSHIFLDSYGSLI
jgi:hypothetical protein